MSTAVRRPLVLAAVVVALAAAVVLALTVRPHQAGAQAMTGDIILSASIVVDPDANGYVVLGGGSDDLGLQAVVCSGSNPQGGTPQIPAQVMCQLRSTTTLVRVKNHVGANVTAPVRIVLFGDFGPESPTVAQRAAFQHQRQVG